MGKRRVRGTNLRFGAYEYGDVAYRTLHDIRWAVFLDLAGIRFHYDEIYHGDARWRPDFTLSAHGVLASVKPDERGDDPLFDGMWGLVRKARLGFCESVALLNPSPFTQSFGSMSGEDLTIVRTVRLGDFVEPATGRFGGLHPIQTSDGLGIYAWGGDVVRLTEGLALEGLVERPRLFELHRGAGEFERLWAEACRLVDGAHVHP